MIGRKFDKDDRLSDDAALAEGIDDWDKDMDSSSNLRSSSELVIRTSSRAASMEDRKQSS